jgi:hypothetical protein
MDQLVSGLTHMTGKQLKAIAHLLPIPNVMEDIGIASKLARSNQGRKRQEGLLAKQIRQYIDAKTLEKLHVGARATHGDVCLPCSFCPGSPSLQHMHGLHISSAMLQ